MEKSVLLAFSTFIYGWFSAYVRICLKKNLNNKFNYNTKEGYKIGLGIVI